MNLIFIAALTAVCGAAKLDRAYLPPASAKTAGGSVGLQTPFRGSSFNDNSLPKGSFTNDFQGVIVDAAAAGTRASGEGDTGLGAPRISYGSTDSRVGDAAFKGTAAGFRPAQNFNRQNGPTAQDSGSQNGQGFNRQSGQTDQNFESQNYNGQEGSFNSQNGPNFKQNRPESDGQAASSQVQPSAQGFNRAQAFAQFQANRSGPRFQSTPERAQAAFDRNAGILRFENDVGPESYHYAFETTNGISAEENGVATNGVQAQGGFSYTGDDGQIYTVTYTADEGGYQPRGDHLPTPPPIPKEILKSLAKNAQDEAAGVIDDGSYDAQRYNAAGDYAESDAGANVDHNDRQTPNFGKRPETDATASGTFINQNNQPFVGQEHVSSEAQKVQSETFGPSSNANRFGEGPQPTRNPANNEFGPSGPANGFGQISQPGRAPSANNAFSSLNNFNEDQSNRASSTNGFGSRKPQRPTATNAQSELAFNGILQASATAGNDQSLNNQVFQASPSFTRPGTNRLDVLAQGSPQEFESSSNNKNFGQGEKLGQNSAQTFGSRNEYLPPSFGQNGKPQRQRPQRPTQLNDASAAPSFNSASQTTFQANELNQPTSNFASEVNSNTQIGQQANRFQQPPHSFNNQYSQNRFSSPQRQQNQGSAADLSEENQSGQISDDFSSRPTSQPSTELTTPFESNEQSQSAAFNGFGSDSPSKRPGSQLEVQANAQSPLTPARPQTTGSQTPFSSQGPGQLAQSSFNDNQPTAQNGFDQTNPEDAQFSPSTGRPSFSQNHAQGVDESYYYRQPSRPFSTPASRFPGAPSGQFNRVTQQSVQSSAKFPQEFPENQFQSQKEFNRESIKYSQQPTSAPIIPTGSIDGQYQGSTVSAQYNGITQASISPFQSVGSTRHPNPTLSSAAPTLASQFNGITQATASSFSSAPSVPFGTRPTFQQTSFNQPESSPQPNKPFTQTESDAEAAQGSSQEVPTQQYNGEIYEYSKPPQGLPSTAQKEEASVPQRGQNFPTASQTRPQFGSAQSNNRQELNMQHQPSRPAFGARPQFSIKPSPQTSPQFGSFNRQDSRPQEQSGQDSNPQFSASSKPFAQSQDSQPPGNRPNCCQTLDSKLQSFKGTSQNSGTAPSESQFGNQFAVSQGNSVGQGQFDTQFSGPTSQPESQGYAGQGETFGGPRKPPSFDQESGYHY